MLVPIKKVSVSFELDEIGAAIDGARIIAEDVCNDSITAVTDIRQAAAAVCGILNLAKTRLRDLGRVARGSISIDAFAARHNAAIAGAHDDDIVLSEPAPRRGPRHGPR